MVETNASGQGIGVVLMQQDHHISFISRALSSRYAALPIYGSELLAIVHALTKWSQYLLGKKFIIRNDQRSLKFLMEQKLHTNSQLMWLRKLMPIDYAIEYKKGIENKNVDALSRVSGAEVFSLVISTTSSEILQAIAHNWDTDPELKAIIEQLKVDPAAHI